MPTAGEIVYTIPSDGSSLPAGPAFLANAPYLDLNITGLTGGGATNLDGIDTANLEIPFLIGLVIDGGISWWKLQVSSAVEDGVTVVQPDDDPTLRWIVVG
jgi:hypothetical protein